VKRSTRAAVVPVAVGLFAALSLPGTAAFAAEDPVHVVASGFAGPLHVAVAPDGSLLVLAGNRVRRYDRATGALLGILAEGVDGGISGGTFLALVPNPEAIFDDGFDPGEAGR
jgi:hypothetical protein